MQNLRLEGCNVIRGGMKAGSAFEGLKLDATISSRFPSLYLIYSNFCPPIIILYDFYISWGWYKERGVLEGALHRCLMLIHYEYGIWWEREYNKIGVLILYTHKELPHLAYIYAKWKYHMYKTNTNWCIDRDSPPH